MTQNDYQAAPQQEGPSPDRQPIFNLPSVIVALIVVFIAIQLMMDYALDWPKAAEILRRFAFVPIRLTMIFDPDAVASALTRLVAEPSSAQAARYFLDDGSPQPWTLVTYAFLHGDFIHLGVNALWLTAFGAPVARRLGAARFLALFVVTAIAGALTHWLFHRVDFLPVVGASASVSGLMAAATRFLFKPGAPLGPPSETLAPLPPELAVRLPATSLMDALRDRRVMQFLLMWFVLNFLFGYFSVDLGLTTAPVAWEAHAGGFLAGFFLFRLFDAPPVDPRAFEYYGYDRS